MIYHFINMNLDAYICSHLQKVYEIFASNSWAAFAQVPPRKMCDANVERKMCVRERGTKDSSNNNRKFCRNNAHYYSCRIFAMQLHNILSLLLWQRTCPLKRQTVHWKCVQMRIKWNPSTHTWYHFRIDPLKVSVTPP